MMYARFGCVWCCNVASGYLQPTAAKEERRGDWRRLQAICGGLELCGWMSRMLGRFVRGLGFAVSVLASKGSVSRRWVQMRGCRGQQLSEAQAMVRDARGMC